ncbi:MAG: hypothetical protein Kow0074_06470 [Candidatus Zixiibacteriota bacterium]
MIYFIDGTTGTLEWSHTADLWTDVLINDTALPGWNVGPQLIDLDYDGHDEILWPLTLRS